MKNESLVFVLFKVFLDSLLIRFFHLFDGRNDEFMDRTALTDSNAGA